jgi:hypothetical protein
MRKVLLRNPGRSWLALAALCGLMVISACSVAPKSGLKRVPEGQQNSGFLKDYANLKANPKLDGDALTYVNADAAHNLRRYVAIIVDPVEVYVSTRANEAQVPERARQTVSIYFRHALESAVQDAFPIVDSPGPLEKVAVEMELVDSVTGERVAAMVDRSKLGEGAEVGTENFSRVARFNQAKQAFDEWAGRVRLFLDAEHELTGEDAKQADQTYKPYGQ